MVEVKAEEHKTVEALAAAIGVASQTSDTSSHGPQGPEAHFVQNQDTVFVVEPRELPVNDDRASTGSASSMSITSAARYRTPPTPTPISRGRYAPYLEDQQAEGELMPHRLGGENQDVDIDPAMDIDDKREYSTATPAGAYPPATTAPSQPVSTPEHTAGE